MGEQNPGLGGVGGLPGAQKRGTWGNHPLHVVFRPGTWATRRLPLRRRRRKRRRLAVMTVTVTVHWRRWRRRRWANLRRWASRRRRRRRRRTILRNCCCRGHHANTQQQTCDDQNSFFHIQMNTIHWSRLMSERIHRSWITPGESASRLFSAVSELREVDRQLFSNALAGLSWELGRLRSPSGVGLAPLDATSQLQILPLRIKITAAGMEQHFRVTPPFRNLHIQQH